jgi:FtsP/CotA-like multicopper oxidase with cupredoxin domain
VQFGERVRLTLVNDTMMNHPMHLHGMWMELENGHGERIPRVHTVNVQPAERLSLLFTADAPGSAGAQVMARTSRSSASDRVSAIAS